MKKYLLFILAPAILTSCMPPAVIATFRNKNVYKTKTDVVLKRVYDQGNSAGINDENVYILKPSNNFSKIRYTVVQEGDNPYVYILPLVRFTNSTAPNTQLTALPASANTNTIFIKPYDYSDLGANTLDASNYYFKLVSEPEPNQHYLCSQSLMGMPITLPIKIRSKSITADLSLGYSFGYKFKISNNPYKKTYFNIIPYALAFNKEKYVQDSKFVLEGKEPKKEETVSFTYYSFGATLEYESFNVGAFVGWDMMFAPYDDWEYQKKPWFSIGFGYKLGKKE
ncbi:MAG: hypothetical protein V4635_09505 [Bacteroidota bacterium]